MDKYILILVTAGSSEEAERIGAKLVEEKLAACTSLIPNIKSIFSWKGKLCKEAEVLMIIKSRETLFPKIMDRVKELHSYEVPEIIAFPILFGSDDYLKWMDEETESFSS
ncbi:MAG: divalent-cation tolerance protein CutA [Thermodesulfobacteriota bacterium]